jgi:hypothetical protein
MLNFVDAPSWYVRFMIGTASRLTVSPVRAVAPLADALPTRPPYGVGNLTVENEPGRRHGHPGHRHVHAEILATRRVEFERHLQRNVEKPRRGSSGRKRRSGERREGQWTAIHDDRIRTDVVRERVRRGEMIPRERRHRDGDVAPRPSAEERPVERRKSICRKVCGHW